jgi:hypothetical protein
VFSIAVIRYEDVIGRRVPFSDIRIAGKASRRTEDSHFSGDIQRGR